MYLINKHNVNNQEFTVIDVTQDNIQITFMDFGATILSILVPDKDDKMETVVLAYDELSSYVTGKMYLNGIIGPTSGRIKDATFTIDGSRHQVEKNFLNTENLHGGNECFHHKFFDYKIIDEESQTQVIFTYHKLESESSFPGNQFIQIIYTVKDGELLIQFIGDTTETTLLNLTSHIYFNLSGDIKRQILDNKLQIKASNTLLLDNKFVPYKKESLIGTHLDFLTMKPIHDIFTKEIYLRQEKGIDNPYMLDEVSFQEASVILVDPTNKRKLEVFTTYPTVVCYTHNFPDTETLLFGRKHEQHLGICFETQNPPNGINIEGLEDSILRKGEDYYHKTLYKFSVEE